MMQTAAALTGRTVRHGGLHGNPIVLEILSLLHGLSKACHLLPGFLC